MKTATKRGIPVRTGLFLLLTIIWCLAAAGCSESNGQPPVGPEAGGTVDMDVAASTPGGDPVETMGDEAALLAPADIRYLGAFRLPDGPEGAPESDGWEYGGGALAYRPNGDPGGAADGFTGSLFMAGFEPASRVGEISIPAPVISRAKNPDDLPVASTLQELSDIGGGRFETLTEIPRLGLCWLLTPETGEKLHFCRGQHFQEEPGVTKLPSHAWCNPVLSSPDTKGAWWIGDRSPYSVNNYIFEIPETWADEYVGGRRLATGRFRDGGWSGKGPALFAYAPWLAGNPPPDGARLSEVGLILYSHTRSDPFDTTDFHLKGYQNADEWEGGAWLTTTDGRSAVIFVGTKGTGERCWYGWMNPRGPEYPCVEDEITDMVLCFNADGTPCPPEVTKGCPDHTSDRGWWSSRMDAEIIFYDPRVLGAVAKGELYPSQPQPYAELDIDEYLFLPDPCVEFMSTGTGVQRRYRIGETAYDREHGLLFVVERFADGAKPIVHVFTIQ